MSLLFKNYQLTILSTGSEVSVAIDASSMLERKNINARVVSMTCIELFEKQNKNYKERILGNKNCYAIEAASPLSWGKYVKENNFIGMNTFGKSAPYKDLYDHFKITSKNLVKLILEREK